jgi:SAM-dependent methyltransferase
MALARHRRLLIDRVAEAMEGQDTRDVLCVGCRNTVELDYFAEKGFSGVKGIDLFSQGRNIIVMDMHSMDFADNSFNVVYASHSLEHSYDIRKVVSEIVRVIRPGGIIAAEVPVHIAITDADRVDFGSVDGVVNAFGDSVDRVLWKETERGNSEQNEFRSDVARVVLRVRKS